MDKQHLGLKILVIVMGIMIIIGTGVVAYTIISRLAAGGKATEPVKTEETIAVRPVTMGNRKPRQLKAFGEVTAKIPSGAVIEDMSTGGRRLLLRLRLESGEQVLHVLNMRTGERLGIIRLQPE